MLEMSFAGELNESNEDLLLAEIEELNSQLMKYYNKKILLKTSINRSLVSFQSNKKSAYYRWYKFKEAFSASLVEKLLSDYGIFDGRLLDPFAGSGTALFSASGNGIDSDGIELLPIGQYIINTRLALKDSLTKDDINIIKRWTKESPWEKAESKSSLRQLRITDGAYPKETLNSIESYLSECSKENKTVKTILIFALLCILESISYTRKDGQYLRWDYRSGRRQGIKPFDKGEIFNFKRAITEKINEIIFDLEIPGTYLELFPEKKEKGNIILYNGSCLDILPRLSENAYDVVFTSPPYCNRYDYTRTYALELALLGIGEKEISALRQEMLSCTVENRAKDLLSKNPEWSRPIDIVDNEALLQKIIFFLEDQKAKRKLNNNGIPRMVRGYFYELACVIFECFRVMKKDARFFMVNDNVRYSGVGISVDLILSHIAEEIGFNVENILVLPSVKGNSSQQMGKHGRQSLRKCIYVWQKK